MRVKKKILAICIRVADTHITSCIDKVLSDPLHKDIIEKALDFFKKCEQEHIFIASSNKDIAKYITSLDPRAFTFNFTNNFEMHCNSLTSDPRFIRHAQEIAASMAVFSRCKKIRQITGNFSSFLGYGIAHNVHYPDVTTVTQKCLI